MNRYANYCTEEQAKRALKLGAPVEVNVNPYGENRIFIPTIEQMIGWLEDKMQFAEIQIALGTNYLWVYNIYVYDDCDVRGYGSGYISRKEASLAAIDNALEYLEQSKK